MQALDPNNTATWTGTYVGQYRTHPDDGSDWGAFTDDSGTVSMVLDLSASDIAVTLTSAIGNTFPGANGGDMPKNSFAFESTIALSRDPGSFIGDGHNTHEADNSATASIDGAFFGAGAAEAGGVYRITQPEGRIGVQVEAVGVFGAGDKTITPTPDN